MAACGTQGAVRADDGFNPFREPETERKAVRNRTAPPEANYETAPVPSEPNGDRQAIMRENLPSGPIDEQGRSVERDDLSPVMAQDGSGLPYELWSGLSVARIEELMATLEIPPRSAALHALWHRLITADVAPVGGGSGNANFEALRFEALDRSGLVIEAQAALSRLAATNTDPIFNVLAARSAIGLGDKERGCTLARSAVGAQAKLEGRLRGEAVLIAGYCAAVQGDLDAASLHAQLARELGLGERAGLDALDAIAARSRANVVAGRKIAIIDWRLLELAGGVDDGALIENATPGLLAALALDAKTPPRLRLAAGEAAASVNAIAPDDLAATYRASGTGTDPASDRGSSDLFAAAAHRAAMFRAASTDPSPQRKTRAIRAFLDDARRAGLYWPALVMMSKPVEATAPSPEIAWFAETAIEVALAAGAYDRARAWAQIDQSYDFAPNGGLGHWLALADIGDATPGIDRGRGLDAAERFAQQGRFEPVLLHRLATVLDALDTQVPIPLWEIASRTPQPDGGHLPDTGVLSDLQDAAKKREFGRTVLLAMRTLGPNGAEGAHMMALGDAIRALKRAGLEADARRLGLEAVFASWPRAVSN